MAVKHTNTVALRLLWLFLVLVVELDVSEAQRNATAPLTDPAEARAINSIFSRWRIRANDRWNTSGDLCSGIASDSSTPLDYSPGIKCDCSYNSSTLCHIYSLRVYSMSDWDSSSNVVGELPEELWTLTYLTNLDLGQNYLTGSLPPSVANLTRMQYLRVGINALSGELPKELGKLTDLRSLAIGTSNFSGPLPSELGNCTRLEELWIDSSGVSGAIPLSFAGLQNMKIMFASDVAFTGPIPDFIGSWSNLTVLRFEGNSFQGPIPSSFSNLRDLTDLRISDLSDGNSPLDFLTNLTALTTLSLRNNNISGSIPSNLDEYPNLSLLDLSFNNFSGGIPDSLFNMSSLVHLFLGNNKLTGSLPAQKTSLLQFIDLSYNELSGSFPSWVSQPDLQLNLVANNFSMEGSNSSVLASGLNCLQRNFPCFRGEPRYSSFAIKCGGEEMRSATGVEYEADNATLGPAAYYVTREERWAVSNVGLPSGSRNPEYRTNFVTYIPNTRDPELYQSSRVSAGSLRYYGLGLQNGGYNISLQFVETKIENPTVWKSLGRRIFNIYIQGNLALKDFDIQKEAGESFRAVVKDFTARVTENHLEIHLFWAGKGTCCVPAQGIYGPSISALSVSPADFIPSVSNNPPNEPGNKKNRSGMIAGVVISFVAVSFLALLATYYMVRRRRQKRHEDEEFLGLEARPYTFTYAQLRAATDDFSPANKLGEGGFGPVYKGTLEDGRVTAVKLLSVASHQGKSQFLAEIETISAVQHRNLVKLYGCCIEGSKRLLVYEYLENKSLDQALFGNGSFSLDWGRRFDICLGVARGLAYLHEESRLRIVHRDVKASNILLDAQLNPKLSDFGLAKLYDDTKTHMSTRVAGTIGYLAPEYAMRGQLTEKADVFGFGVVALEIISGRPNSDSSQQEDRVYLLEWAWHCHENNRDIELVDKELSQFNEEEARRVIGVALVCSQTSPVIRPSMSRVVAMLCGDAEIPVVTSKPGYLTEWNFSDITAFDVPTHIPLSTHSPIPASEPMLREVTREGR
ncbi:probable LRR receptor-like serine/threonine-protein kinase At1g56130 isoform X2 [Salvia miltiorrhiza]|uniref:probable LRR receptor-like serine/threonine-protein kinase At1g56130 isoform X2 n=1 Tax=Salvia miltiorrhiza TaxID=226208 RepID=UPI0025AB972B|nr:probable LRR receptor-like serine/threonine-protein kinase At1g56130 isoform X2 [Salvia miltiorrhiza]